MEFGKLDFVYETPGDDRHFRIHCLIGRAALRVELHDLVKRSRQQDGDDGDQLWVVFIYFFGIVETSPRRRLRSGNKRRSKMRLVASTDFCHSALDYRFQHQPQRDFQTN
jgi:hypothetical protein